MSDIDRLRGFHELMVAEQQGVSPIAEYLGERMVRELPIVDAETRAQATYDARVEAGTCTPPAEAIDEERGAQVVGFGLYMGKLGFPGATRVSPVDEHAPVEPAQPARPSYREALGNPDAVVPVKRASAARALFTGKVKPQVEKEPTWGYAYAIGTPEVEAHPKDGGPVGSSWQSSRETPDVIAAVVRKGESGKFDTVEVGIMPSMVNGKGEIVPKGDEQPLPLDPGAEVDVDYRFGSYHRVISLGHITQVQMDPAVRAMVPANPRGAYFADANGDVEAVLVETAKAAQASRTVPVRLPAPRTEAPVVASQPFRPAEEAGTTGVHGNAGVVEGATTTPNGVVPTQRGESDPVTTQ